MFGVYSNDLRFIIYVNHIDSTVQNIIKKSLRTLTCSKSVHIVDQFTGIPKNPIKKLLIQTQICDFCLKLWREQFFDLQFLHHVEFEAGKECCPLGEIPQHPLHIKNVQITHEVPFFVKSLDQLINLLSVRTNKTHILMLLLIKLTFPLDFDRLFLHFVCE